MTQFETFLARLTADPVITHVSHRAYVLATVRHECADQWLPISEYSPKHMRPVDYFTLKYEHRKDLGNMDPADGYRFRGRGFVQLTGRANYERFSTLLDVDLVGNPDRACDYDTAYSILQLGMSRGLYTGKKLADYDSPDGYDFVGARRIINGKDRAELIAGYAQDYLHGLQS